MCAHKRAAPLFLPLAHLSSINLNCSIACFADQNLREACSGDIDLANIVADARIKMASNYCGYIWNWGPAKCFLRPPWNNCTFQMAFKFSTLR